jgi:hypothetical protein
MASNIDINAPQGAMTASQEQSDMVEVEPGMALIWSVGAVIVGLSMAIGMNWFI